MTKIVYLNSGRGKSNGRPVSLTVEEGYTLKQLLADQGITSTRTNRVAVNGTAVPEDQLERVLSDQDIVTVLAARQDAGFVACGGGEESTRATDSRLQRVQLMRAARGMWRDRDDLAPVAELRADWDRGRS